jgi:hypothetical protein
MLTDQQRQRLSHLVHEALLRIRILGWHGRSQEAADLADAFHNVPAMLWADSFDLTRFRDVDLASYQSKYPDSVDWQPIVDEILGDP